MSSVNVVQWEATPVDGFGSPWAVLPAGQFAKMAKLVVQSSWAKGRKGITVDLNGVYFVSVLQTNEDGSLLQITTRPEAGKINIGPKQNYWIEEEIAYPLLKGASDFSACYVKPKNKLYALVPNRGITKDEYDRAEMLIDSKRPLARRFFHSYRGLLENRSTFRGRMPNAPYYAIYNVGSYTFAPWKVVWAEQKNFCAAVISFSTMPETNKAKVIIPDHKLFFVDFHTAEPAYFLCGLLNTEIVRRFIESHVIKTQIGNVFKHLNVPPFLPENSMHNELVDLVEQAHGESNSKKRMKLLSMINSLGGEILA